MKSGSESTPLQAWITGLALFLLGSLAPVIILVAMALTLALGRFALVIAPIVALVITTVSCAYVFLQAGRRWFWFYVSIGLACSLLVQLWPIQTPLGVGAQGADALVLAQASAVARWLHRSVTVLWVLGAGYVWYRKRD